MAADAPAGSDVVRTFCTTLPCHLASGRASRGARFPTGRGCSSERSWLNGGGKSSFCQSGRRRFIRQQEHSGIVTQILRCVAANARPSAQNDTAFAEAREARFVREAPWPEPGCCPAMQERQRENIGTSARTGRASREWESWLISVCRRLCGRAHHGLHFL
jgi:hypothetical protein